MCFLPPSSTRFVLHVLSMPGKNPRVAAATKYPGTLSVMGFWTGILQYYGASYWFIKTRHTVSSDVVCTVVVLSFAHVVQKLPSLP